MSSAQRAASALLPARGRDRAVTAPHALPRHGTAAPDLRLPRFGTVDEAVAELRPSDPLFCVRPTELRRLAGRFVGGFPGRVLYAVKCNPHSVVLRTLYDAGIRDFDVASLDEIALVDGLLGRGAGLFFNNPAKARTAIRDASRRYGVRFYTADHASEVDKIVEETRREDDPVVAVRFSTRPRDARYALSTKFGAPPDEAVRLLRAVHRAGLGVGLAFHVGSQCLAPDAFTAALATCGQVIREAAVPVSVLNVGGGFPAPYPGDDVPHLEHYLGAVMLGHRRLGLPSNTLLLCEPGRSLVATAASVVVQVLVRKDRSLYVSDGIFGSLQELRHPKERRPARLVRPGRSAAGAPAEFTVFGPTCDSDDVLAAPLLLPEDTREGDWIEIGIMGAYSLALRTRSNGFSAHTVVAID
jgi:ornithine decarboxylase